MKLKYFNSFMLTGAALLVIAVIGIFKGNEWLGEPGMPVNPYGWQIYLLAAVIMFVNGIVSIKLATQRELVAKEKEASGRPASHGAPAQQSTGGSGQA